MVPANTGDYFEVRLRGVIDNQQVITTLHYILDLIAESRSVEDVCNDLDSVFNIGGGLYEKYYLCLSSDYTSSRTEFQRIYPNRSVYYTKPPAFIAGQYAGTSLPPGNSIAITTRSDLAGRSKVGGVRMPAVPIAFADAGLVTPAAEITYNNFGTKIKENVPIGFGTSHLVPVIFHRAEPILSVPVTQYITQLTLRTMSRRVVGRGI